MYRIVILLALLLGVPFSARSQSRDELLGKAAVAQDTLHWAVREDGYILRREASEAFDRMQRAARRKRIRLTIVSAYRPFERQVFLWERKWNATERSVLNDTLRAVDILQYSSMPGTSRHHWGTDMDLNSVEPAYFEKRKGRRIYRWLTAHAAEYGFFQPYSPGRTKGYADEPWHWSYAPLSKPYLDCYLQTIGCDDLRGFAGDHTAPQIDVIGRWVDIR